MDYFAHETAVIDEDFPDEGRKFFHKVGESVNEWEKVGNHAYFWFG